MTNYCPLNNIQLHLIINIYQQNIQYKPTYV